MADECCIHEITALKDKIEESKFKVKELKDEYRKSLITNLEKGVKIRNLKKKSNQENSQVSKKKIPDSCLQKLRCIANDEKQDAEFIRVVLKELYEPNGLKYKSISGRSKRRDKTELTPEKKLLLEQIYSERLENLSPSETDVRKSKLPTILRKAIDVASRKA